METVEPEIRWGRRAFPKAQELFGGAPIRRWPDRLNAGWHDSARHPETGAFCLVRTGAGLDDLIGEVLLVTGADKRRSVRVYCLGALDLPVELSLTRRAFAALALLSREAIRVNVDVLI